MKKITTILLMMLSSVVYGQNPWFTPTLYRGAIDPDTSKNWTRNWTNWNPVSTGYPSTTITINGGDITQNTTWTKNNVYLLNDAYVYITGGATLTIEPGTIIRGKGKGTIIVCRGSKIHAKGTQAEPIVFTSSKGSGLRSPGDWGGIVLTGRARHNLPQGDTAAAEGGIAKPVTGNGEIDGRFGGNNDEDSSGVLSYCRIEFAGIPLTTASNSEINGLTFYAVGNKTSVDHIQVSYCGDDSYEWFGGTVNCKYIIAYGGTDDDFDTDNGYRGNVQFGIGLRLPAIADQSGSNAFESDNDANGSANLPRTAPVFSNMTIVGPLYDGQTATVNSNYQRGAHIRRNSALTLVNSIMSGYPLAGLFMDSRRTNANFQDGTAVFSSNIIAGIPAGNAGRLANNTDTLNITSSTALKTWLMFEKNDTFTRSNEVYLLNPNSYTNPDFTPAVNSPARTGTNFRSGKTPFDVKPVVLFSAAQSSPDSRTYVFTNNSHEKGMHTKYFWDFGVNGSDKDTSSAMNPVYTFPANGTFTITLLAYNAFDSAIQVQQVNVMVSNKPVAAFNAIQNTSNGSRNFTFRNVTDTKGEITTYAWDFGVDNATNDTSSLTEPDFTFPANGIYHVRLIATNQVSSDTVISVVRVIATGDHEINHFDNFTVFPNPASEKVTMLIPGTDMNSVNVKCYDGEGKECKLDQTGMTTGNSAIILDVSRLDEGIYFIRASAGDKHHNSRLMIRR